MTGDATHLATSRRALDWLVANQQADGGFGLPRSWGVSNKHNRLAAHFGNGTDHPAGTAYGVNVVNCGRAGWPQDRSGQVAVSELGSREWRGCR
ncbi:hypothetical protein [Fodinicola acaciae]|uniref:hypothetical protein n=1 Tax=Fodinicola acaciae TaxID=2681555 RepID=UPI0013D518C7|nr:hypothetical protein [Fodinicola acaciae]